MFKERVTDVFFDLDHTLWDFERNSALTFGKIFAESGIAVDLEAFLQHYVPINHSYWKLFRENKVTKQTLRFERLQRSFQALGEQLPNAVIDTLSDAYIDTLSSFNHVFPGAYEILTYLKPHYKLHIITNGFDRVHDRKLRNADLDGFFSIVVNSEMAGVKKPDPGIFEMALAKAGARPEKSLMIGDNLEADILGAMKLGMYGLHFNSNDEPEHGFCPIITDLVEIKSFL